MKPRLTWSAALIVLVGAGCADEFDPYNVVVGHRVLGVRATPPDIGPGDRAVLDALVTSGSPSYAWSWCPLSYSEPATGECPLGEDELGALLREAGSDAEPPSYDLGTEPTAELEHTLPPEILAQVCQGLRDQPLPEGVGRPACNGRYEVTVRLVASSGDDEIVAVRKVGLVYAEDYEPNANPTLAGARVGVPWFDLTGDDPVQVGRGFRYKLELDVQEEAAESYAGFEDGEPATRRESLTVSWFRGGGEMDKARTSFLEGTTDFENLTSNEWVAPAAEEVEAGRTALYFVLRDHRGGIDWLEAELELVE